MKTTTLLLAAFLLVCAHSSSAQRLQTIQATIHTPNKYKKTDQVFWQKALSLYSAINLGKITYEKLSDPDKKKVDSLESGYGPLTQSAGCSWYCGGGPYKTTASSSLKSQGGITYEPANIHDFDLFTAWIPDNTTGAIGKQINFHFKPFAPRINQITIWNGYIKNTDLWKANSRVAQFKLLVNGVPTAILELKDLNNAQSFNISPIQSTDSTKDLVLTLEILSVYKGTQYHDVAISEVNFGGLDVHCFGAGTTITMANHSTKKIEEISQNDRVLTYNQVTGKLDMAKVSELVVARHTLLYKLKLTDREIIVTDDHPFWTNKKNWAAINPAKTNACYNHLSEVIQLNNGDGLFIPAENKFISLVSVETIAQEQLTYTLELTTGDNFIANGLLVKTEKPRWVSGIAHKCRYVCSAREHTRYSQTNNTTQH